MPAARAASSSKASNPAPSTARCTARAPGDNASAATTERAASVSIRRACAAAASAETSPAASAAQDGRSAAPGGASKALAATSATKTSIKASVTRSCQRDSTDSRPRRSLNMSNLTSPTRMPGRLMLTARMVESINDFSKQQRRRGRRGARGVLRRGIEATA